MILARSNTPANAKITLQIEFLPRIKTKPFQRPEWRRSAGICWPRRSWTAEIGLAFRR
jgi:hypothetical protein